MVIETRPWDAAEYFGTPQDAATYLDTYLEDGNTDEIRAALRTIARSHGMIALSKDTGITREALYKVLGDKSNPTLDTLLKVTKALGVRLATVA